MRFLKEMLERAQSVDPKKAKMLPAVPVQEGDIVLCECDDELKRLYVALHLYMDEICASCSKAHAEVANMAIRAKQEGRKELTEEESLFIHAHDLKHQNVNLMKSCFWNAARQLVQRKNKVTRDGNIAVREGWVLVTYSDADLAVELMEELTEGVREFVSESRKKS